MPCWYEARQWRWQAWRRCPVGGRSAEPTGRCPGTVVAPPSCPGHSEACGRPIGGLMRWCTYVSPADAAERVGLLHEGRIHGLAGGGRLVDLLGDDGQRMAEAADRARNDPAEVVSESGARFLAPVPYP